MSGAMLGFIMRRSEHFDEWNEGECPEFPSLIKDG